MPQPHPLLTGWAPFRCAERLSGQREDFVKEKALETLSHLLPIEPQKLASLLEAVYVHDWQNDPFSRGAYSYVKVGGKDAPATLSEAVKNTLFFAGEATDLAGNTGTVHGAIASGMRAAKEILRLIVKGIFALFGTEVEIPALVLRMKLRVALINFHIADWIDCHCAAPYCWICA